MRGPIVALAGGVGAARFLDGLAAVLPPQELIVIGNTGDDVEMHGLHVSPDLDTVAYTLAGLADDARGWGLKDETFTCLGALQRLGEQTWFRLGDRDLATHLFRSELLRRGVPLSGVTARLCRALGARLAALLPMSDDRIRTQVHTASGTLDFQVYFVERQARDEVHGVSFDGVEQSRPAPGVLESIRSAVGIIICPSNPVVSIGPILAVPGIRQALAETRAPVAAVSPIVGGRALKGPADRMMRGLGMEASARQVAALYRDFLDVFILDCADQALAPEIEQMPGLRAAVTDTIMSSREKRTALAKFTLEALGL